MLRQRRPRAGTLPAMDHEAVDDIENLAVLKVQPLTALRTPKEIIDEAGGKDAYVTAVRDLEDALFRNGRRASSRPAS